MTDPENSLPQFQAPAPAELPAWEPPLRRRRRGCLSGLAVVFLVVVGAAGVYTYREWRARQLHSPIQPGEHEVVIPRGSSARMIAELLETHGVVRSSGDIMAAINECDAAQQLRAGRYRFVSPMTPVEVVEQLCRGPNAQLRLTVPEGFTVVEIAQRAHAAGVIESPTRLVNLCWDEDFIAGLGLPPVGTLEGYLFPATYYYDTRQDEATVVTDMVRKFRRVAGELNLWPEYWTSSGATPDTPRSMAGLSPEEVVILASVVEREAALDEERALMAGVLLNRLKRKMKLGCSATLRYALSDWDSPETRINVRFDSPYNTYRYAGLPPGPICNPGAASLQAALHPEPTEMLFFTAITGRRHHFSRTYDEHKRVSAQHRAYYEARMLGDPDPERHLPAP